MRYLAIDLGQKRTGLAVGDDVTNIVTPAEVIQAASPKQRLEKIEQAILEHAPDAVVLGLPLNMDGSRGAPARSAEQLAEQIRGRTGIEVCLCDERLTSVAADEQLSQSGLTHKAKKLRRDALAAAAILRDFLAGKSG